MPSHSNTNQITWFRLPMESACVRTCAKTRFHRSVEERARKRRTRRLKPTLQAEARATRSFFIGIGGPNTNEHSNCVDEANNGDSPLCPRGATRWSAFAEGRGRL